MFLSMVVDPTNSKAISGNLFDQRFNVAASRARDRMYLVRSVKASDLSEKDLRLTLLAHFDKPMVTDDTEHENLIDRCESGFERQVFIALTELGYAVRACRDGGGASSDSDHQQPQGALVVGQPPPSTQAQQGRRWVCVGVRRRNGW